MKTHRVPHAKLYPPRRTTSLARQALARRLLIEGKTTRQVRRALRKAYGVGLGGNEIAQLRKVTGTYKGAPVLPGIAVDHRDVTTLSTVMRGLEARGVGYSLVVEHGEIVELQVRP